MSLKNPIAATQVPGNHNSSQKYLRKKALSITVNQEIIGEINET